MAYNPFQTTQHISGTSKSITATTVAFTTTSLTSLASSATAGWQSDRVSNMTTLANDYEIYVSLLMANTAPANDKCAYVYVSPWFNSGGTFLSSSIGTTTLPTGSVGTVTIASPNNLRLLGVLNYTTAVGSIADTFYLSNAFGTRLPDAFSLVIINFTGAATASSGCTAYYTAINDSLQ